MALGTRQFTDSVTCSAACPGFFSVAVVKKKKKRPEQLGEEKVCFIFYVQVKVHRSGKARQESGGKHWTETMKECYLMDCFPSIYQVAFWQPRTTCPVVEPPTVGSTCLHQSLVKKLPPLTCPLANMREATLVYAKLTKLLNTWPIQYPPPLSWVLWSTSRGNPSFLSLWFWEVCPGFLTATPSCTPAVWRAHFNLFQYCLPGLTNSLQIKKNSRVSLHRA